MALQVGGEDEQVSVVTAERYMRQTIVVADDTPTWRRRFQTVLGDDTAVDAVVHSPDSAFGLFNLTLGLRGNAAVPDLVVLDFDYTADLGSWLLDPILLRGIASMRGVDLNPLQNKLGHLTNSEHIDGLHLAILLRYLGYGGNMIIASQVPPDVILVQKQMSLIRREFAKFAVALPSTIIQGIVPKSPITGKNWYCRVQYGGGAYVQVPDGLTNSVAPFL